jgi:geranylgeranyl pyrophosphate synthase
MEYKNYIAFLLCRELTTEHRRLAEIIEMIHTASLIHDDVLDESDMWRGRISNFTSKQLEKSH